MQIVRMCMPGKIRKIHSYIFFLIWPNKRARIVEKRNQTSANIGGRYAGVVFVFPDFFLARGDIFSLPGFKYAATFQLASNTRAKNASHCSMHLCQKCNQGSEFGMPQCCIGYFLRILLIRLFVKSIFEICGKLDIILYESTCLFII